MTARYPMPDLLGRHDEDHGEWDVRTCAPVRGEPKTSIVGREMFVPVENDEKARVIRAHEMMHARVTPGAAYPAWVARGAASDSALRAAEEFRVNWLVGKAGFDVKTHLADGDEKSVGERLAETGNWTEAVYFAAACAGTASMNPFLVGIRRHRRDWAPVLREIEKRLARDATRIDRTSGDLGDTTTHTRSGLAPSGFRYTEAWAVMLDGIANPKSADDEDGDESSERQAGSGRSETVEVEAGEETTVAPPVSVETVREIQAEPADGSWPEVRVGRAPLTRPAPGGLGRTRRAADRGRSPRRIHRLLVDPQRRVFDQHRRGNGGVVLVDGSGSMSLTEADVRAILAAAPGATVAIYACSSGNEAENLWVLADRGRMVDEIPARPAGNGVDAPAIEWALKQRQHSSAPVVWVTDGAVHYPRRNYQHRAAVDCVQAVLAGKVTVRPNVKTAIVALQEHAARRRPPRWFPQCWHASWKTMRGERLRNEVTLTGGYYVG